MKKLSYTLILSLCVSLCLGCGYTDIAPDTESKMENSAKAEENASASDISNNSPDDTDLIAETNTVSGSVSMSEPFGDTKISIKCTGLAQYDKIESDDYSDKPADGNVYLVLFLNIRNYDINNIYFSAEAFHSSIDGNDVSHTFLVNDPEGYPPIFQNISPKKHLDGYVVWEVPQNWKELSFNYSGCVGDEILDISGTFTPDDLAAPVSYDQL